MAQLKYKWRQLRPRIISAPLFWVVRCLCSTLRYKLEGFPAKPERMIFCGWHGRSMSFANYFRNRGWWVLISHSSDGQMQARVFGKFGFQIIRGSTGRGGERALVEAIRTLEKGGTLAMTPDGPRGPSGVVQGGVVKMAQKSGAGLVPVGISARPRRLVATWDKYMVPAPFAKCLMIFGEPIYVDRTASKEEIEEARLKLENEIHRLEREAESRLGNRTS